MSKSIEDILRKLDRGEYLGEGGVDGASKDLYDLIVSVTPELPAVYAKLDDFGVMTYKKATDEYEFNIARLFGREG